MKPKTFVVSDLHVGAGKLDDCDSELESGLLDFLKYCGVMNTSVELIINGDFLDFAQAPPWKGPELESVSKDGTPLCFTVEQSCKKLEAIFSAHKPIFAALHTFLDSNKANRLVILPGNHDADFFWTDVRDLFYEKIFGDMQKGRERLVFHLEQVYRPLGNKNVWIEHGHQYDDCNSFYINGQPYWSASHPPILHDKNGVARLFECTGTRFLIRYLNQLDEDYSYVDNIKPFSKFLRVFGASALLPGYGSIKAMVSVWGMLRYLAKTTFTNHGDLLGLSTTEEGKSYAVLRKWAEGMDQKKRLAFKAKLAEYGFREIGDKSLTTYLSDDSSSENILNFLSQNLDLLDSDELKDFSYLGVNGLPGTLTLAKGFNVDETKELKKAAKKILKQNDIQTVIMGHTHEEVRPSQSLPYLNIGTWTRYKDFRRDEFRSWDLLRNLNPESKFPYKLNYADISSAKTDRTILRLFAQKI